MNQPNDAVAREIVNEITNALSFGNWKLSTAWNETDPFSKTEIKLNWETITLQVLNRENPQK